MAHTKAIGSTQLGRDSQPKYLGVKKYDGETAKIGNIIVRQRGSKYLAGEGVRKGSDDTIYAVVNGKVKFTTTKKKKFDGSRRLVKVVNIIAN
jgi:large subunit ribosomal protein L27